MASFLEQVFTLLTNETGSLTYHLVIAFSIAGALQSSINHWRSEPSPQYKRMVTGLSLLLALRLVLFLGAMLAWQRLVDPNILLPLLDRAVSLVSILLMIWLWAFPHPSRGADAAALLIGFLTLTMFVLGVVWSSRQGQDLAFQGSLQDTFAATYALVLIVAGGLLLLVLRPSGWGYGLAMLALFLAGDAAYLAFTTSPLNGLGALRLAQMVAFPLLLVLPERFPVSSSPPPQVEVDLEFEPLAQAADPRVLLSSLALAVETNPEKIGQLAAAAIAHSMQADMCLLVTPPRTDGLMTIQAGYDLIRVENLTPIPLDSRQMPTLASALRRGRLLRLPVSTASQDLASLARSLDLARPGDLLAAPMDQEAENPYWGILLFSPYSGRSWSEADQNSLAEISQRLVQVLHKAHALSGAAVSSADTGQPSPGEKSQIEALQRENQALQEQFALLSQSATEERNQLQSLAAVVMAQENLQELVASLRAENENLKQVQPPVMEGNFEGELRLALEEVAYLNSALAEADQKLIALSTHSTGALFSTERLDAISSLARELRQPMTSIAGYVDFLLSESVGILGPIQRKYLERVKVSTERMSRLVNDLVQVASPDVAFSQLDPELIDLGAVIDETVTRSNSQIMEKGIVLDLELPSSLPPVQANRAALQQVVSRLLRNALAVTAPKGKISVHLRVESSDGRDDYLLLQVTDAGGGIPPEEIPHLFSQVQRLDGTLTPGVGETNTELAVLKARVESLGGRIWVDSRFGRGATFSIVLPVHSPLLSRDEKKGSGA